MQEGLARLRTGNDAAETAAAAVLHVDAAATGAEEDAAQDADHDADLGCENARSAAATLQNSPGGEEEQQQRLECQPQEQPRRRRRHCHRVVIDVAQGAAAADAVPVHDQGTDEESECGG